MKITTEDLQKLLDDVTPGEWNASPGHEQRNGQRYWQVQNEFDAIMQNQFCWAQGSHEANASLIAMVPDLAREVIALRAAAEKLAEALRSIQLLSDCHSSRVVAKSAIAAYEAQQ